MQVNEQNVLGAVVFVALLLMTAAALQGCSFKVEWLYHGQTPVGLDNRTATQLTAAQQPRVTKVRED